ncbi:hypothetical protein ULG90_03260 [Halopseudomonas pachastrellae]|nr:hypothetical protein ULG90_03260 [Halopseudomonas pachastrellae]
MLYKKFSVPAASFAALFFSAFCHAAETSYPLQDTPLSGGAGSVDQHDQNAYSLPQGNMPMTRRLDFSVGNSFFRNPWVVAPSSTDARDGLGRCSTPTPVRGAT